MPFVYLLECADGTLYAGWTTDLERRLEEHNAGRGARYTRGRRPVTVAYCEEVADRSAAQRREAEIRRLRRSEKLELIRR
ncbi:MAG: GIY-YIG nuclease family protein [Anaerolineae bacterium]